MGRWIDKSPTRKLSKKDLESEKKRSRFSNHQIGKVVSDLLKDRKVKRLSNGDLVRLSIFEMFWDDPWTFMAEKVAAHKHTMIMSLTVLTSITLVMLLPISDIFEAIVGSALNACGAISDER